MYSYTVTYPLEKLLGAQTKKDLKTTVSTLATPVISWVLWIGISILILPKIWRVIIRFTESGGLYLLWEPDNWSSLFYATLMVDAAALLLVVSFLFNWSITKSAIRIWKENAVPTAKDYGVSDGLHFGDGTIIIEQDGIALVRNKYRGLFRWDAISEFFYEGSFIGMVTATGTKINFGYTKDDGKARHFMDQAVKSHGKAISQS